MKLFGYRDLSLEHMHQTGLALSWQPCLGEIEILFEVPRGAVATPDPLGERGGCRPPLGVRGVPGGGTQPPRITQKLEIVFGSQTAVTVHRDKLALKRLPEKPMCV